MMRTVSILLLVALVATAVMATPQDIKANRPPAGDNNNGGGAENSLTRQVEKRVERTNQLNEQLRTNIRRANEQIEQIEGMNFQTNATFYWVLFGTPVALIVILGYTFLEAGNVRSVNVTQVLLKNFLIVAVTALVWWAVGYAFSYGDNRTNGTRNGFIGNGDVFLSSDRGAFNPMEYAFFVQSLVFAATATIIATQTLGERTRTLGYVLTAVVFAGFVYPVVVHWQYSTSGWISPFADDRLTWDRTGAIDLAHGNAIHVTAGFAALAATLVVGPRTGRFDEDFQRQFPQNFRGSNRVYQGVGIFFLWVGMYAVTGASSAIHGGMAGFASKITINTTLGAAFGALVTLALDTLFEGRQAVVEGEEPSFQPNTFRTLNGVLTGLIAVSAGAHVFEPYGAMLTATIAAIVYVVGARLLIRFGVDDPLEAVSTHALGGLTGVMAVGWFGSHDDIRGFYGDKVRANAEGIWEGGEANLWGTQSLLLLATAAFAFVTMAIVFGIANFFGFLRTTKQVEADGLDANEPVTNPEETPKENEPTA